MQPFYQGLFFFWFGMLFIVEICNENNLLNFFIVLQVANRLLSVVKGYDPPLFPSDKMKEV